MTLPPRPLATALTAAVLVSACGGGSTTQPLQGDPKPPTSMTASPAARGPRLLDIAGCSDISPSVRVTLFATFNAWETSRLQTLAAQPGGPEVALHIRVITSNSVASAAGIATVKIPAVPDQPLMPTPSGVTMDQLYRAKQRAAYQQSLSTWTATLAAAQADVSRNVSSLLHLKRPVDRGGSDVVGCPAAAARLFAETPGATHELDIATDAIPDEAPPVPAFTFPAHTRVEFFPWCESTAAKCDAYAAKYVKTLVKAGASVTRRDPSDLLERNGS